MIIKRVIVLEEGTCCHRAALHMMELFNINPELVFVESFQEAKDLLVEMRTEDTVMLVPHVNDIAKELTFAEHFEWDTNLLFSLPNPKLFLVKGSGESDDDFCAALPVLKNLVDKDRFTFIPVSNTQEAARFVEEGRTVYGITNENGVKKYNLEVVKELKHMEIVWFAFRYLK